MKQINVRIDDELAKAVYAKLATKNKSMQSLIQGFFETWLNEDDVTPGLQTDNSKDLQQELLNDIIMAKLNQLEKNQDDLIERVTNDSNQIKSIAANNDSLLIASIANNNSSNDSSNDSNMIAKVESIEIENLQNKTKLENLEIEFIEFKETIKNQLDDLKTSHNNDQLPSHKKLKEIANKGITRLELSKLLNLSVRTIENHSKDIESYTKKLIGIAYKYDVKTRLYYQTND